MWESEFIDTTEAGAGSYPEPPEPTNNSYIFVCECSMKAEICVEADSYEDALSYVESGEYDELYMINHEVERVIECKVQD